MKILFFSEQSPYLPNRVGGAENSMRLIAEGLAARGHDVTFASLRADARPLSRSFTTQGLRVLLCPSPRRSLRVRLRNRLGRAPSRLGAALDAAAWSRVRRGVFADGPYDVLYVFYEMEFLDQALEARAAEAAGLRIVLRMAGMSWHDAIEKAAPGARRRALIETYARTFNGVDAINYLSQSSRDLVTEKAAEVGLDLAPRSDFIADIGVNAGKVPLSWRGPGPEGGLNILVATRFSPQQKRQDILIEALGLLKGRLPFKVTMVGTGATAAANMRRRDALGLTEAITILPFMPQEELWAVMRGADLLCHPCDHEGVSKIILESMMLGLPVLASDVAPLPDYVIEGETGYRVANTPEAWAAKLLEIAAAKDRLPALSAGARAFVEARYNVDRNIDLYEERFKALSER